MASGRAQVPLYFSHSYRREDRDLNDYFWKLFHRAGFSLTVDPGTTSLSTISLELMMARSAGFAAVVTFRPHEPHYQCSPFIIHEYGLAVLASRPRLVLRDKRVSPNYFKVVDTLDVEFDVDSLDRSVGDLQQQLAVLHQRTAPVAKRAFRQGRVGLILADDPREGHREGARSRRSTADWISAPATSARRDLLSQLLNASGDDALDLGDFVDDYLQLTVKSRSCDFVVIDLDRRGAAGVADFLQGLGIPLLKMLHRGRNPALPPQRLLKSAPLSRVASDEELVVYWTDHNELAAKLGQEISRALTDRREFKDYEAGHRYFRSLGREALPVFVSNSSKNNAFAQELTDGLSLENIPYFHYRWHNTIELGRNWAVRLDEELSGSRIFVPLIDDSYWASTWCRREYELARELEQAGRLRIVPYLLEETTTGPELPDQGADLRGLSRAEGVQRIVGQLDKLLATQEQPVRERPAVAAPAKVGELVVDVAIVTILKEEYEACLRYLSDVRSVAGSEQFPNQHSWVVGRIHSPLHDASFTVVLAKISPIGTSAAVMGTANTLEAFSPQCLLVVGVAGGLQRVGLADVVVADRICAYEYGQFDETFTPRTSLDSAADRSLTSAAETLSAQHPRWFRDLNGPQFGELEPHVVVGPVGSGDKVIDDQSGSFFQSVLASRPDLIAVEMEGSGAAVAVQNARERHWGGNFTMIRGISDLPTEEKARVRPAGARSQQAEIRDSWKERASAAAASCAVQLIRLAWPRPPRERR
jgi:nucleoside phosphorylase